MGEELVIKHEDVFLVAPLNPVEPTCDAVVFGYSNDAESAQKGIFNNTLNTTLPRYRVNATDGSFEVLTD